MVHYHSELKLFYLANVWKMLGKAIAQKSYTTIACCIFKLPKVLSKVSQGHISVAGKGEQRTVLGKIQLHNAQVIEHTLKHFS